MRMFQVFPNALRKSIDILHSASEEGGRATVAGERCGACGERMHCISPWDIVHLASGYGASRKVGGRARELHSLGRFQRHVSEALPLTARSSITFSPGFRATPFHVNTRRASGSAMPADFPLTKSSAGSAKSQS